MTQQQETLIEFPCRFPIKVMGAHSEDFAKWCSISPSSMRRMSPRPIWMRVSKNGNYLSVTVTINATVETAARQSVHGTDRPPAGENRFVTALFRYGAMATGAQVIEQASADCRQGPAGFVWPSGAG